MKFSYQWLKEVIDIPVDAESLARELTMVGIQLESIGRFNEDFILDFEITVNRPDCLSVYGLAREIATIFGLPAAHVPELHPAEVIRAETNYGTLVTDKAELKIIIEETNLCARYCGQLIADVRVGPSPPWIVEKLESCGLRPVNSVVDITNLVMVELGQPLHAFDFALLEEGTIRVRKANNERLMMIDGRERVLRSPMLVIADEKKAQAVAGVMGGAHSEVSPSTKTILLESAYFDPASVRRTSKSLELSTDASYRFERGADYLLQSIACRRAAALIEQVVGGKVYPVLDVAPLQFAPKDIQLRYERMTRVLGSPIDPAFVENTFPSLGFTKQGDTVWRVPSFRVDVHREIDLIEEIARHYGYNKFPETLPAAERKYQPDYATYELERSLEQLLRAAKIDEAYTYSLVAHSNGHKLLNPISEVMIGLRSSILPGLIDSMEYNLRHRNEEIRLFEIARVFLPEGEKVALGIGLLGEYRELKGIIESSMSALGYAAPFIQEGKIMVSGTPLGKISQKDIEGHAAQLCEIYLTDLILLPKQLKRYQPIIPFPFVERDISFFIDDTTPYSQIEQALTSIGIADLRSFRLVDRYHGANVPAGKGSLTLRLIFQSDTRTLTSGEVDILYEKIVKQLQSRLAIEIRR